MIEVINMVSPLNRELQELRMSLEHYKNVLMNDAKFKERGNPDNCMLLTDEDIDRINLKIKYINEKINELLDNDNGYSLI